MSTVKVPKFDVNDDVVTIVDIYVKEGELVHKDTKLFRLESTKMVREILAECEGYIYIECSLFEERRVGDVIANIYSEEKRIQKELENNTEELRINATEKAFKRAEELNIDIRQVAEQKGNSLIKAADVEAFVKEKKQKKIVPMMINQYDRERVLIIGAGRLSEQIIDILLDDKEKYIVGLVDSYKTEYLSYNYPLYTYDVFKFYEELDRNMYDSVIIAFGGDKKAMKFREDLYHIYKNNGIKFSNAIGDNTNIRRAVSLGENNIIMHNCFIGTGTEIGNNNIISYGTCIGHHCIIGDHNLFAPGFMSPGSIKVGSRNIFMTGVNSINYIEIEDNVVLPVGYNITDHVKEGTNKLK